MGASWLHFTTLITTCNLINYHTQVLNRSNKPNYNAID